jgi:hypothetical protein
LHPWSLLAKPTTFDLRNFYDSQIFCEHVINVVFRNQIQWPQGEDLSRVMVGFKDWCGPPSIDGAIDYT